MTRRGSAGPAIVRALAWHSLRSAFGIGRGAKAKIFPVAALHADLPACSGQRGGRCHESRQPAASQLRQLHPACCGRS